MVHPPPCRPPEQKSAQPRRHLSFFQVRSPTVTYTVSSNSCSKVKGIRYFPRFKFDSDTIINSRCDKAQGINGFSISKGNNDKVLCNRCANSNAFIVVWFRDATATFFQEADEPKSRAFIGLDIEHRQLHSFAQATCRSQTNSFAFATHMQQITHFGATDDKRRSLSHLFSK